MSRRDMATSVATRLGMLNVLERLPSRPSLVILTYHRIMRPEDSKYDPNVIEATPDQFDEQLAMLKRRFDVVDPEEMVELVDKPSKLRHLRVGITFDDGYIDNYEIAFPLLKKNGLKALFFLATSFVGSRHLTWWDRIAWMVRHTKRSTLRLRSYPTDIAFDARAPELAIRRVLGLYKKGKGGVEGFLEELEEATSVAAPVEAERPEFLSWEQAREMQAAGMAIGSHTHRHLILAQLPAAEQLDECVIARKALLENDCAFADCIAYPVGGRTSFDAATRTAAESAGYRFGFSNFGGVNHRGEIDRFNIRRLALDESASVAQLRLRLAWTGLAGAAPW